MILPVLGFPASPMSTNDVELFAQKVLGVYDPESLMRPKAIDIFWFMEDYIFVRTKFSVIYKPDSFFKPHEDAFTDYSKKTIYAKGSDMKAYPQNKRIVFTLAHESCHVLLHYNQWLMSIQTAARSVDIMELPPYLSSEWQANKFAAFLLMPTKPFKRLMDDLVRQWGRESDFVTQSLSDTFGVSMESAFKRMQEVSGQKNGSYRQV